MGMTFTGLSIDDLCDLMCGDPEMDEDAEGDVMAKSNFEKAFEKMTPAQRKKNMEAIGDMFGMPPRKPTKKKTTSKKK